MTYADAIMRGFCTMLVAGAKLVGANAERGEF
jgi:hypothetical protein